MPPSTRSKTREPGKKTGDCNIENEMRKLQLTDKGEDKNSENCKSLDRISKGEKRPDSSYKLKSSSHGGEGRRDDKITVDKKQSEMGGKEKRGGSVIIDKVPKKNAQRAKGHISINKCSNKGDEDSVGKKRPAFSADNLPRAAKREGSGTPTKEVPTSVQKPKPSEKSLRTTNSTRRHTREPVKEESKGTLTKRKKPSWNTPSETSEELIKSGESQIANLFQEEPSQETDLVCAEPPPSASCSFFGKLQQGVKAYFSSRNSLKFEPSNMGDDKTKKKIPEEGLQSRVRVSKGGKEEHKKRNRKLLQYTDEYGIKIKNKISISESDLYNGPRFYSKCSKLGGKTNYSFDNKPKIKRHFRMLKHKNLYRPQKHYVRIQIPRKGYFYRSTIELETPDPSRSEHEPMEPSFVSTNASQIPISGLATTSVKGANIFKKRLRRPKHTSLFVKPDCDVYSENAFKSTISRPRKGEYDFSQEYESSFTPKRGNKVGSILTVKMPLSNLQQGVGNAVSIVLKRKKGSNNLYENITPTRMDKKSVSSDEEEMDNLSSESSFGESIPKKKFVKQYVSDDMCRTVNFSAFSSDSEADQSSDESGHEYAESNSSEKNDTDDNEKSLNSAQEHSDTSWQPIEQEMVEFETINEMLNVNLNHLSLKPSLNEISCYEEDCNTNYDTIKELVEIVNTFENFNIGLPKQAFVYQASVEHQNEEQCQHKNESSIENILTAKLMGNIDLHLELENYLKAISTSDDTGSCKARTKNTLQPNHSNCTRGENTFADFEGPKIVENKLGLSNSAVELTCFEHSEKANLRENYKQGDSHSRLLFNEGKIKSASSFESAISVCIPLNPPRNENFEEQLLVFRERNMESFAVPQEYLELRSVKGCASQTLSEVLEENKNVKKVRSENDANHIKRSFSEISLQGEEEDVAPSAIESVKLQYSLPVPLSKEYSPNLDESQSSLYEKLSPLDSYFEGKPKLNNKSNILYKNSLYSTSAESLKPEMVSIRSDPIKLDPLPSSARIISRSKLDIRSEDTQEEQEQVEIVSSEKTQASASTSNGGTKLWSPSLRELVDIYNSILKQNKKIGTCTIDKVKRCFSDYLISFVHDKIREKIYKKELIRYAKDKMGNSKVTISKPPNVCKKKSRKEREKKNLSQLVEYVNMFQELLSSSLSINQITQLNNTMAGFQDYSLKSYNPVKTMKNKKKKKVKEIGREKKNSKSSLKRFQYVDSEILKESEKKNSKSGDQIQNLPEENENENIPATISFSEKKLQETVSAKPTSDNRLESDEVELPPPVELESVLKSCLTNSDNTVQDPFQSRKKGKDRKKKKFLVNVKLSQSKIIVNGMRQLKNEKAIKQTLLPPEKETSDLIIECVSNKQMEKLKVPLKGKPSKSYNLRKNGIGKRKNKKLQVKESKQETHLITLDDISTERQFAKEELKKNALQERRGVNRKESTIQILMHRKGFGEKIFEEEDLGQVINKFEYNHHQLKIQHPIEAIIESSESKIIEKHVEDCNEVIQLGKEEQKYHVDDEIKQNGSNILLDESVNGMHTKSINSVINNTRSGEEPNIAIPRTRSYVIDRSRGGIGRIFNSMKKFPRKKLAKFTKTLGAMDVQSSKKSTGNRRKLKKTLLSTPWNTYFCYPYIQTVRGSLMTLNKGVKDRNVEAGYVLKTDLLGKGKRKTEILKNTSKASLSHSIRGPEVKRKQSRCMKVNSKTFATKTIKKTEPKIISDANQVLNLKIKQDDRSTEVLDKKDTSGGVEQKPSTEKLKSPGKQEPKNSDQGSTSETCSNTVKKENADEKRSGYYIITSSEIEDGESTMARVKRSFTSQHSATSDSYRRPTLLIHSGNNGTDDTSFPSLMALSESFLKCYSTFALSSTKIKSLFKSHSDMKFYPGRVVDSLEDQTPFVTFVLTPKQKATAGLPDNQTVVKEKTSEQILREEIEEKNFEVDYDQIDENPLKAIELFIETLSASRKACRKQANKNQNTNQRESTNSSKACTNKCTFTPCRRLQALYASKRKAYHECQKKLILNGNVKQQSAGKSQVSNIRKTSKTKSNFAKINQRQGNPKKNERAVVKNLKVATSIERKTAASGTTSGAEEDTNKNEPSTVTNENPNDELIKINLSPEFLEQIKIAIKGAEKFKNKKLVIDAIDEYHKTLILERESTPVKSTNSVARQRLNKQSVNSKDSKRKLQKGKKMNPNGNLGNCKNLNGARKSLKGINADRKLKTVKMKTHCAPSNISNKPKPDLLSKKEEIQPEPQQTLTPELSNQSNDDQSQNLKPPEPPESLERIKVESLERVESSVYFDAEESECRSVKEEGKAGSLPIEAIKTVTDDVPSQVEFKCFYECT